MTPRRAAFIVTCIVAICSGRQAPAAALTIYDSAGFEPPRFLSSQNLQGQDAPPAGQGPWLKDAGVSTGVLQTTIVSGGVQSVRITRVANGNGDTRWAVLKPTIPTASENLVAIDFDLRVEQANGLSFGPAFGVECYDSSVGAPKLIGSLTVDATTGDVLYSESRTGILLEAGTAVPRGVFLHYTLLADFTERTYSVLLEDALLQTEPFVDNSASQFTDAPLVTFAVTEDTINTATGSAYFDNYLLTAIPEPCSVALAIAGLLFATSSRFRRL